MKLNSSLMQGATYLVLPAFLVQSTIALASVPGNTSPASNEVRAKDAVSVQVEVKDRIIRDAIIDLGTSVDLGLSRTDAMVQFTETVQTGDAPLQLFFDHRSEQRISKRIPCG